MGTIDYEFLSATELIIRMAEKMSPGSDPQYSDVKWVSWCLKSLAFWLFVEQFVYKADIKENIKACVTCPLWVESTGHQWIPLTKGQ